MRLSGRPWGDIVQVNDGLGYLALVRARSGRRPLVDQVAGHWRPGPVKPNEVTGHWRRTGPRPEPNP